KESVLLGYQAANASRGRLASLGVSESEYAAYRAQIDSCVSGRPVIQFVRLDNRSRFSDAVLYQRPHVRLGQPLDETQLENDISQIYALGFLDRATFQVIEDNGQTGLLIRVKQDERGTSFIETGLDFTGVSDSSSIDVRVGYLKTNVTENGAEFRGMVQLGQHQGLLT